MSRGKEDIIGDLMLKYADNWNIIESEIKGKLKPMRLFVFYLTMFHLYDKAYLVFSSAIMIFGIYLHNWPYWSFFLPIIPIIFILVYGLIKTNSVALKLIPVCHSLKDKGIHIELSECLLISFYILCRSHYERN